MDEATTQNKQVILIIDDDKFLRTLLSQKLKSEGMVVVEAENGQEGLVKMKSDPRPHIVLLDLLLPVVDGFEVLKSMQNDSELKRIPVVALSNLDQEESVRKAKALGAKDCIVKAYLTAGEIVEKIKTILRQEYF